MSPEVLRTDQDLRVIFEWRQDRALVVALLGPPGAGKSAMLAATAAQATEEGWLVLRIDLSEAREFWAEDDFYGWLVSTIQAQWPRAVWKTRQPRLDFTRLLEAALVKSKVRVLLVFDHLEGLCDGCARSLISSLREVQDIGSSRPGWSKLRCIVSGAASVYELRRRSGSPNLQFVLRVLPDSAITPPLAATAAFLSKEGRTADAEALALLAEMTGGEAAFLELFLRHLSGPISKATLDAASSAILADAARVRQLAIPAHLYLLDRDFQTIADGLLAQRFVAVPDPSEDVNWYQLLGATRIERGRVHNFRFRNGLVEQTIRLVSNGDGHRHDLTLLRRLQEEVLQTSSLEKAFHALSRAWKCLAGEEAKLRIRLCAIAAAGCFEITPRDVRPAPAQSLSDVACAAPFTVAGIDTCVLRRESSYLVTSDWNAGGCGVTLLVEPNGGFSPSISSRFWIDLWARFLAPLREQILELALPALGRYALQHGVSTPKKIFVSSTFLDLAEHRLQIMQQIQRRDLFFRGMEYFGANSTTSTAFIKEQVRSADVYLGIFAFRYGSIDPASGISMTEIEYDEAMRLKKPRLCYVAHREATFRGIDIEMDPGKVAKLGTFLRKVKKDVVYEFKDIGDLARQVYADLGDPSRLGNGG